jgi:hypothetical protein
VHAAEACKARPPEAARINRKNIAFRFVLFDLEQNFAYAGDLTREKWHNGN